MEQTGHPSSHRVSHRLLERLMKIFLANSRKRVQMETGIPSAGGNICIFGVCFQRTDSLLRILYLWIPRSKRCSSSCLWQNSNCFQQKQNELCIYSLEFLAWGLQKRHTRCLLPLQQDDLGGFCYFLVPLKPFSPWLWDSCASKEPFHYPPMLFITGFRAASSEEESYEFSLIIFPAKSQAC